MLKIRKIEIFVLYLIYSIFLLSSFFLSRSSMISMYAGNLTIICVLLSYLLIFHQKERIKFSLGELSLFFFTFSIISFFLIRQVDVFTVLFYTKLVLLLLFFKYARVDRNEFISFLNSTYLIYCLISLLFYFDIVPFKIYQKWDHPTMYINLGFFKYFMFYGLEGNTSFIDSYSGFIVLINIFLNSSRFKRFYISLSLFFLFWSLKLTPVAGVLASVTIFVFIRRSVSAFILVLIGNLIFVLVIIMLVNHYDPLNLQVSFWQLMYVATHARSMIWEQQIIIMLEKYTFYNYLFGGYDSEVFSIPSLQLWGEETGNYYDNPHNSYLILFFRSPILFLVYYFSLVIKILSRFRRKEFVLVVYVLIICYTNSTILGLQNPIYILFLVHILTLYEPNKSNHKNEFKSLYR